MYINIGKAARMIGVSRSILRGWNKKGTLKADYRTEGRHRRYSIQKLLILKQYFNINFDQIKNNLSVNNGSKPVYKAKEKD